MEYEMFPRIPHQITTEILSKFLVKSLLQFKCVSKSWRAFISSREFMKAHFRSSFNNHRSVTLPFEGEFKECILVYCLIPEEIGVDYPSKNPDSCCFCVGSVNGLICVFTMEDSNKFYLWNPTIKKAKKLPELYTGINLSCYRSLYGFGYDEVHDDYKVVVISDFRENPAKVVIYSLKTDSWRRIDDFKDGVVMDRPCKFVNGKLYWVSCARCSSGYSDWEVVCFDLANETWGKLEQPNYEEGTFDLMPGVLGGDLVVLCSYKTIHSRRAKTDVWIMKDDGVNTTWTKMFTCPFPFPNYAEEKNMYSPPYSLCGLTNMGENLPTFQSVVYRLTRRSSEVGEEVKELYSSSGIYVPSLVNPLIY